MSLFRNIIDAGLAANLKQNELKVLLVLLRQTIGFGKSHDHLTDKRIAQLSGLRVDRCRIAVDGLIQKGLFDGLESNEFEFCYEIPEHFLAELDNGQFFTPHIPKNREIFRETENISEKRRHTTLTPTPLTLQPQHSGGGERDQPEQAVVTLPEGISPENQQACRKAAQALTADQQSRVNQAYCSFVEDKAVRSPAGLYLTLVKAEQAGTLIVPEEKPPVVDSHASFKSFDEPDTQQESSQERASKLAWLTATAHREGETIDVMAAQFGMSYLLVGGIEGVSVL